MNKKHQQKFIITLISSGLESIKEFIAKIYEFNVLTRGGYYKLCHMFF